MEIKEERKYNDNMALEYIDIQLRLNLGDKDDSIEYKLDNLIYYLICAKENLIKGEVNAYELILSSAKEKLDELNKLNNLIYI